MDITQDQVIKEVGIRLHKAFPTFHGYFRFNMNPNRDGVNVNVIDQITVDIEESKQFKT